MPSPVMDRELSLAKAEKMVGKMDKSQAGDASSDRSPPQALAGHGYCLAQTPSGLQMLPFQQFVQPLPHPLIAPVAVGAQQPHSQSPLPLAIIPTWALPYPVRPILHGEPNVRNAHVHSPNGPTQLLFPPNAVAALRPVPIDMRSPNDVAQTPSGFNTILRRESYSSVQSVTDSRHPRMGGVFVGDSVPAKIKQRLDPRDLGECFSICRKHERTRKTRLRPDSSLRTGKRKYRCETCTAILEQWTETYGARPTDAKKQELLSLVGMTPRQLNYWFANRRRTDRLTHAQETGIMASANRSDISTLGIGGRKFR